MRIQRKRIKGWRMPAGSIYVGRPTKWGNPFSLRDYTIEDSLKNYRNLIEGKIMNGQLNIEELKGKDLACWCKITERCHVVILIDILSKRNS